jgi:ferredoxin--NADP+ reductase
MNHIGTERIPLKVAVIGSGPSGFYATEALFRSGLKLEIDMFERLPIPYGLVRSGVAPDHPKLKQPIRVYAKIAETPGFSFFGNVTIGTDVSVETLKSLYHAVIFTCGAESDRRLGIPGEDLPGSHTATEFVGWYNGHPDFRDRELDLSHGTAVIFGQGNVAADVARMLAKTRDELKNTDIAGHALDVLAQSKVRDIYVIGRRGPAQAKFTSKELKEFGELEDCQATVDQKELALNPQSEIEIADKSNAGSKKVFELFGRFSLQHVSSAKKRRVHFTFLKSPVSFSGTDRVEKARLEINALTGEPFSQSARGTGQIIELEAGIAFRSIGYKGTPIAGLPFNDKRGIIPNQDGRIVDGNNVVPNCYVAGWIKRGPTGIIGTNRADSVATVQALLEDFKKLGPSVVKGGKRGLVTLLNEKGLRFVSFTDWQKINQREIERGLPNDKPREKYTCVEEMLGVID